MAITYFGSAATPAPAGSNTTDPVVVTPPGSMVAGQLIYVITGVRGGLTAVSVLEAGGQNWTTQTLVTDASISLQVHTAVFNGTWSADPSWTGAGGDPFSGVMHVFSPTSGYVFNPLPDTAQAAGNGALPASPPYDVSIASVISGSASRVALFTWAVGANYGWTLQTGGFTATGASHFNNTSGSGLSLSTAHLIQTGSGATGAVVNQTTNTGVQYTTSSIAFTETPVAVTGWQRYVRPVGPHIRM
jgi:hypothetical protein